MKHKILHSFLLLVSFSLVSAVAFSQSEDRSVNQNNNYAFAVTGEKEGSGNWIVFRQIDLSTGKLIRNIYVPSANPVLYDAASKLQIPSDDAHLLQDKSSAVLPNLNSQMVAALAYDAKYNRLYFTLMKSAELRYIDLNTTDAKMYAVKSQSLKPFTTQSGEADIITRMTFSSDGYGYALTNSSDHLLRFSTGDKIEIKDLGALKEGYNNGANNLHTPCTNWGGDMISDASGNLYVFSMHGNIFKINTHTLVADIAGTIKNLPQGFNVNAVAIDDKGSAVLSSAIDPSDYYKVNMKTFEATAVDKKVTQVYNASDFANANFAFKSEAKNVQAQSKANVTIFPNPVTNKNFTVQLSNLQKGNYTIELSNLAGKKIFTQNINVNGNQDQKIILPTKTAAGVYMVRVISKAGLEIFTDKIVID